MDHTTHWLDNVQQTCQQIGHGYIDIIIDQSGMDYSVIPALSGFSPAIKWQSLYQGLPEDIYPQFAPLLVRIELKEMQQVQWLYELAREVVTSAPLLVVASFWPFQILASWFRDCADASHEGRAGIFRFWDARIFSYLLSTVLNEEQKGQLHQPAIFWSWVDRDGEPVLQSGNGALAAKGSSPKITFTDAQFEALMCLCDAKQFLTYRSLPEHLFSSAEEKFSTCFSAMLAATKARLLFEEQRDAWVLDHMLQKEHE